MLKFRIINYFSNYYKIPKTKVLSLYEQAEEEVKMKYGVYNDYLKPLTMMIVRKWLEAESISVITDKFLKTILKDE